MNNKMMPKVLAIYLPQFHETDHNNQWWGDGFTDWESVKSAESCFEGHDVPWEPYRDNYYDLSKRETIEWQANLAKKYGVDGFCFYHYYFENGQMELEKPAENLLKWKDINIPFCFNWASESWIRSWSRLDGNVWSEKYEGGVRDDSNGILVKQDYGTEEEWKAHFEYLLPFFKDSRYIRIGGKPVFIFYRPNEIKPLNKMVALWRGLANENGLEGLYLIGVSANIDLDLDASLMYEPRASINKLNAEEMVLINNGVRCYEYKDIWETCLARVPSNSLKTYYSGVIGYDDTPRRGNQGECLVNKSPKIFQQGLTELLEKSVRTGNELVFLNAWNEWGEGMYLEPDSKSEFEYLEALKTAKETVLANIDNIQMEKKQIEIQPDHSDLVRDIRKYKSFIDILDKWLYAERQNSINLKKYFQEKGIESIAIYGMAMMGKQLYQQLDKEGIIPAYGIDQYVGQYGKDFKIYRPEDTLPDVDMIIVTTFDNEKIIAKLHQKVDAEIITLEELINRF